MPPHTRLTGHRLRAVAWATSMTLLLAGCGTLPLPGTDVTGLAGGRLGAVTWSAVVFPSSQEGTCVEIRFSKGDPQRVCQGSSGGPIGTLTTDAPDGAGLVVLSQVLNSTMTAASVTLADGTSVPATLAAGAGTLGRYVVAAVPAPGVPVDFQLTAPGGTTLETIPLR